METKKGKATAWLFGVYCAGLLIQNTLAMKNVDIFAFTMTTGVLISPLLFIIQDVSTEVFGYKQTKEMIKVSFLMNFVAVALFQLAIALPASALYANQSAFETILGSTLRITIASFSAYLIGSLMNSKVMVELKRRHNKNLFFRAITSTAIGQFLDNAVFSTLAFIGVLPMSAITSMIIGATLIEVIYEMIFYPVTKKSISVMEDYIRE